MKVFEWYIFKNLLVATLFTTATLTVIVFLTQSLRFLELVVESGASSGAFWLLTMLALPRFLEIILPLSLMAGTIFVYNRMTLDSELVIFRSAGFSPSAVAKPALMLGFLVTVLLWIMTMWVAPKSLAMMQEMRQIVKAQFSALLFRPGVFNELGQGLTFYIRERTDDGTLKGLLIHDNREDTKNPAIVIAKRGVITTQDDGYQVLVYEGSRQEYDPETRTFHRLNFERYTIDLPDSAPVRQRWKEAEERTFFELLNPNPGSERDMENIDVFQLEIHRRIISPLLAIVFTFTSSALLLLGPVGRRGMTHKIIAAVFLAIVLQGLFLVAFNLARQNVLGLYLMYFVMFCPLAVAMFFLSSFGENMRRSLFYAGARG